jgi:hypothetical protein
VQIDEAMMAKYEREALDAANAELPDDDDDI